MIVINLSKHRRVKKKDANVFTPGREWYVWTKSKQKCDWFWHWPVPSANVRSTNPFSSASEIQSFATVTFSEFTGNLGSLKQKISSFIPPVAASFLWQVYLMGFWRKRSIWVTTDEEACDTNRTLGMGVLVERGRRGGRFTLFAWDKSLKYTAALPFKAQLQGFYPAWDRKIAQWNEVGVSGGDNKLCHQEAKGGWKWHAGLWAEGQFLPMIFFILVDQRKPVVVFLSGFLTKSTTLHFKILVKIQTRLRIFLKFKSPQFWL